MCRTVLAASWLLGVGACGEPSVSIEREVPSPDGALVARYYSLYSGAPGHVLERVAVGPAGAPFDAAHADYVLDMAYAGGVTLTWSGARRLTIAYPAWAYLFRRCPAAPGVALAYDVRTTPDSAWGAEARANAQQNGAGARRDLTAGCP